MGDVMNLAPAGWYRTSGICASAVPENYRAADRGGDGPAGSSNVQRLTREPSTTGMTCASQAIRRAISALTGPPKASDAEPIRPCSTARLTVTTTCGRSPPSVGSAPSVSARWASSTSASASRCAAVRRSTSVSVVGRGAASGLRAERTISAAAIEPSAQLIAAIPVVEIHVPPALRLIAGWPTVLIDVGQHPFAQHRELTSVEDAGLAGQLGLHLGPLLRCDVRRDPDHDRADHRDIVGADRMLSHRGRRRRQLGLNRPAAHPSAG